MSVADLLLEGVNLMLIGMGIVFVFLMLLVLGLYGMSWLAHRLAPDEAIEQVPGSAAAGAASTQEQEIVAVISAAIQRYRKNKR